MLTSASTCIFYGNHTAVLQRMLDYDFLCGRTPSVAAILVNDKHPRPVKVFFGSKELFIPQINTRDACRSYGAKVLINFASHRSAPDVLRQALKTELFEYIFTVAEGIPERETRELIALSQQSSCRLIGPSVVWWIISGTLRVWNTWGSLENIMLSRLYRPWSVGIVSKSGWMMNELCRVVASSSDGVHTAMQVWGDRFPMTRFVDIVREYEAHPDIRMIVLLGEVWNEDENEIAQLIQDWEIKKPVVAWVAGTSAETLTSHVQFWHAGAKANADAEKATYKNNQLKQAGAYVPESYETFGNMIHKVRTEVLWNTQIAKDESVPEEITQKISLISNRRPTAFTSTITDERGEELLYNWVPVQEFVQQWSLAKVIWHLRLKKELPSYACTFIDTSLILLADHWPAVSGATNTIVTARAWKDLVTSLIAWLATIWPRFGWAIDGAARWLREAGKAGKSAEQVIDEHKLQWTYIQWIGHRIKSIHSPDGRCELLYSLGKTFPKHVFLDLAKNVEALTTQKKPNLILNVDGHIAAMLLDIFADIWLSDHEIEQYIDAGLFNGLFVVARTIGFIGHYLDQARLDEGLYRTARDQILYSS